VQAGLPEKMGHGRILGSSNPLRAAVWPPFSFLSGARGLLRRISWPERCAVCRILEDSGPADRFGFVPKFYKKYGINEIIFIIYLKFNYRYDIIYMKLK
jgi:hypothetical protein